MEALKRVLYSTSFYQVDFIDHLHDRDYHYIIAVPSWPIFPKQIMRIQQWQTIDDGIEVAEFEFKHFDPQLKRPLRYVMIRQKIAARPQARGKQPSLFKQLDELNNYRFSLLSGKEHLSSSELVCRVYRPRANDENVVKDLKEGYGFAAFNLL